MFKINLILTFKKFEIEFVIIRGTFVKILVKTLFRKNK